MHVYGQKFKEAMEEASRSIYETGYSPETRKVIQAQYIQQLQHFFSLGGEE